MKRRVTYDTNELKDHYIICSNIYDIVIILYKSDNFT